MVEVTEAARLANSQQRVHLKALMQGGAGQGVEAALETIGYEEAERILDRCEGAQAALARMTQRVLDAYRSPWPVIEPGELLRPIRRIRVSSQDGVTYHFYDGGLGYIPLDIEASLAQRLGIRAGTPVPQTTDCPAIIAFFRHNKVIPAIWDELPSGSALQWNQVASLVLTERILASRGWFRQDGTNVLALELGDGKRILATVKYQWALKRWLLMEMDPATRVLPHEDHFLAIGEAVL